MTGNKTLFSLVVNWLSPNQGGRKKLPGHIYIGDVDIEGDVVTHRWCFRIVMDTDPIFNEPIKAKGEFLLDSSPFHLMKKNRKLSFYEGNKLVAIGEII